MKNWKYLLIFSSVLISSCASILNDPKVRMDIYTTEPATILYRQDTLTTENNKTSLYVYRAKESLELIAYTDSIHKDLDIKSRLSPTVLLNGFAIYGLIGDMSSDRIFEYPPTIHLDMSNSTPIYYSYGIPEKRNTYINFSLPNINNYFLQPYDWTPSKTGTSFLGIGVSFDFYYRYNRFFNASFFATGGITSARRDDGDEFFASNYFSVSDNIRKRRWSYGYGLSAGQNSWEKNLKSFDDAGAITTSYLLKEKINIGAIFTTYYQLTERFYVGLIYRPSFIDVKPIVEANYEHSITIDFQWKFRRKK